MTHVASIDLANNDPAMLFFKEKGLKDLLFSMVRQSVQDLVDLQQGKKTTYDIRVMESSAQWLRTDCARHSLSYLMPDVNVDVVVRRIYDRPHAVLKALKTMDAKTQESGGEPQTFAAPEFAISEENGGADVDTFECGVSN